MIELDEEVRERIAMDAARDVQCGGPSVALARRTIDAVLSHLNTPEPYTRLGREVIAVYLEGCGDGLGALQVRKGGMVDEAVEEAADYLRKRDEERDSEMLCRFLKVIDRCIVPTAPLNTELRCEFRKEFHS